MSHRFSCTNYSVTLRPLDTHATTINNQQNIHKTMYVNIGRIYQPGGIDQYWQNLQYSLILRIVEKNIQINHRMGQIATFLQCVMLHVSM